MKKTFQVCAFLACTSVLFLGCATMHEIGRIAGASVVASLPRVDFPALRQLGVNIPPKRLAIGNGVSETELHCELWAYKDKITVLGPGDIAYNKDVFEPFRVVEVPVLMRCYGDPELTDFVGVARHIFQVGRSSVYRTTPIWIFGCRDIIPVRGKNPCEGTNRPKTNLEMKRVEFGRNWLEGTSVVQFVNLRADYYAVVNIGELQSFAEPRGGLVFIEGTTFADYAQHVEFGVRYVTEDGTLVGTDKKTFSVPTRGVWARQIITSDTR